MKKYILIIGLIFLVFNTLIGFLISSYNSFNVVFVDINILLSIALCLFLAMSKIESTYKITLAIIFIFTGFVRVLAALKSADNIQDNRVVIGILIVLAIEIVLSVIAHSIKKEA